MLNFVEEEDLQSQEKFSNTLNRMDTEKVIQVLKTLDERTVRKNGEELTLTPIEFDLLVLLIRNKNVALTREKMLNEVWNIFYEGRFGVYKKNVRRLYNYID